MRRGQDLATCHFRFHNLVVYDVSEACAVFDCAVPVTLGLYSPDAARFAFSTVSTVCNKLCPDIFSLSGRALDVARLGNGGRVNSKGKDC